ncbi:molecular chaperone (plasmid) [Klebsiella pasteurii]|uniref:fimbrial biogenesis chaperone n=1 Tax=Klebsiella pasteurii TaxID=2587529 RepID=UPI002542E060|nr:molecular chaperone [Klebsiella pasteurii]WII85137.1 molecular chaperone [Klebsiella pasteurii]
MITFNSLFFFRQLTCGLIAGLMTLIISLPLQASGIGLGLVRLVYNQQDGQATVPVRNTSSSAYLISSRVSLSPDGYEPTPFIVSPPLFRLEANSQGMVRVVNNASSLPTDRESVFYMTVAGIPASTPLSRTDSTGFVEGGIKFAYGNTIKLFYRPGNLSSTATEAAKSIHFIRDGNNIKIENPSPYYVTFRDMHINGQSVKFGKKQPDMIPPFSSMKVPATRTFPISQAGKVRWSAVVDMGAVVTSSGILQ